MPAHARVEKYEMPQMVPKFTSLKIPAVRKPKPDRPGWIPSHITENWDTDPFAYQTEKELMPAGGLHGYFISHIVEVVRVPLEKQGLMLLIDTFLLYRNSSNVKNRIDPDLLLMEYCSSVPFDYDLDIRQPPRCIIDVTSPKSSFKDLEANVPFYFGLGVETYLIIDAITPQKKLREPIELHLWRKPKGQTIQKISADSAGYFCLPEMNIKIAVQQQRLIFANALTGEVLRDYEQLYDALEIEAQRADVEAQRADVEAQRAKIAEQRAETAFSEGEQKRAIKTARAMLADGLDADVVMKYTGLSPTDLASL